MFGTNPFKAIPKNLLGDPIVKKTESKKTVAKKPAIGKKPKKEPVKKFPEKKITCPYCGTVNTFPEFRITRYCSECGKVYFRP
jgi:hypothetical protein